MKRIKEKIIEIEQSLQTIKKDYPETYKEFKQLKKLERDGIFKNIEHAIQNVIDNIYIITKEEDLDIAEEDYTAIELVEKEGIIRRETSKKLKTMKGLRNHLVHGRIDDEEAYKNINQGLHDFKEILKQIRKYVKK